MSRVLSPAEVSHAQARAEFGVAAWASTVRALIETTKPGITRLVTMTALIGYAMGIFSTMASSASGVRWTELLLAGLWCGLGTAMTAAGANALNQVLEIDRDARMDRTRQRPLPRSAVRPRAVIVMGMTLALGGTVLLAFLNSPVTAILALACLIIYLLVYTPMKPRSAWSTIVGTLPGAIPMLIGWTAARPEAGITAALDPGAVALFVLMTVWQIPHFGAIAWMYREDYARGGYKVLTVRDESGAATAWWMVVCAAIYVPVSAWLFFAMPGHVGWFYLVTTVLASAAMLHASVRFLKERSRDRARRVFFLSIAVLPIQMLVLVGEAGLMALLGGPGA